MSEREQCLCAKRVCSRAGCAWRGPGSGCATVRPVLLSCGLCRGGFRVERVALQVLKFYEMDDHPIWEDLVVLIGYMALLQIIFATILQLCHTGKR